MIVDKATYCQDRKDPTPNQVMILLEQVNHLCPKCGKVALKIGKNGILKKIQIAHVFPNSPTDREKVELRDVPILGSNSETIENWIPLCRDCHDEYDHEKTREMYMEMYELKKRIMAETSAKHALANEEIEEELVDVVKRLEGLKNEDMQDIVDADEFRKHVMTIKEKIPADIILQRHVVSNVTSYFSFVRDAFKTQCSDRKFRETRDKIRVAYDKCVSEGLEASSIYATLTNWLVSKVHARAIVCEIIVSYFIQNCDIYGTDAE